MSIVLTLLNDNMKFGFHIPFNKSFEKTARDVYKSTYNCFQIYISGKWRKDIYDIKDVLKAKHILSLRDVKLFIHGSNRYNLCGLISNTDGNDTMWLCMMNELDCAVLLGCSVVLHMGSHRDTKKGIELMCENVRNVLTKKGEYTSTYAKSLGITTKEFISKRRILLENSSHEGNKLGYNLTRLTEIMNQIKDLNVGICIDTCHAFAAGWINLSTVDCVKKFFKEFDAEIGLHKLELIHFNDSQSNFGSRLDRHAPITCGKIYGSGDCTDAIKLLLEKCYTNNISLVQEVNPLYAIQIYEIIAQFVMDTPMNLYKFI
ncbi:MAG TPA: TIM barrel protein [Nitrosarchaeum sp.]|nr:TIM barrel protein [Nitrosarchaeum sp.]